MAPTNNKNGMSNFLKVNANKGPKTVPKVMKKVKVISKATKAAGSLLNANNKMEKTSPRIQTSQDPTVPQPPAHGPQVGVKISEETIMFTKASVDSYVKTAITEAKLEWVREACKQIQ
jgi:hypothetical protein